MAYHWTVFMEDCATMQIPKGALPEESDLTFRRRVLANKKNVDQVAVNAAHARLVAWIKSGDPMPMWNGEIDDAPFDDDMKAYLARTGFGKDAPAGSTTPAPTAAKTVPVPAPVAPAPVPPAANDDALANVQAGEEAKAWDAELKAQLARHTRRRSAFPSVRPGYKEGKRSG